ncbi:MAG: sulfatase-like hydrolase/transferase [Planctomycetota bacterium]
MASRLGWRSRAASLVAALASAVGATAGPPNIVWVLSDDAGYRDFGFQGNAEFADVTPNIDRIATEGLVAEQAYVTSSVCSPSRAGMLTGRYPQRFGFENNLPGSWNRWKDPAWSAPGGHWATWGLDLDERTIADRLGELGYDTALVGKWHQGLSDRYTPNARGFDYFYGLRSGSRLYEPYGGEYIGDAFPAEYAYNVEKAIFENGERQPEHGYFTDRLGEASVDWIEGRQPGEPFFLFLSFTAPHTPMQADDARLAWARERFPDLKPGSSRLRYVAMMKAMDENVGRVLDALEEKGFADNTIVVFFNDNGGSIKNASENTPLRGHKWGPFEGGLRIPMAIRWPGLIEPGGRLAMPVSTLDLTPTLLAAAGGDPSATRLPLDGIDMTAWLDDPDTPAMDRTLFWREANRQGRVRVALHQPWKLVLSTKNPPMLFDLSADPVETNNLIDAHPSIAAELEAAIAEWETGLVDPAWN